MMRVVPTAPSEIEDGWLDPMEDSRLRRGRVGVANHVHQLVVRHLASLI